MTLHAPATLPGAASPYLTVSKTFLLLLASIVALEFALEIRAGFYGPVPIAFYAVAFVLCVFVGVQGSVGSLAAWAAPRAAPLTAVVLMLHLGLLLLYWPVMYLRPMSSDAAMMFPLVVTLVCMLCVNALAGRALFGDWQASIILIAWAWVAGWVVFNTPVPGIDTYPMTQESCAALLHGQNPYAIHFTNIYTGAMSDFAYPSGFTANGKVLAGYSYPPLTLLMCLPSYVVFGDHRYANLAALIGVGAILFSLRPGLLGTIAAGIFLTSPRIFAVLESAWSEPFVLFLLAATLWCAVRCRAGLPYVFGLFLCSKQHMFLFAPAALWLLPRPLSVRDVAAFYGRAFAVGLLLTLPFVLWSPKAFYRSVIELQLVYHSRPDALSFPSFLHYAGWPMPPRFMSLALVPLAYGLAWWRVPKTLWGFALTLAFVAFCTLAFDQAFLNRNFFVLTTLIFSVATLPAFAPQQSPVEAAVAVG